VAATPEDERPADPLVERVDREDGRYLLYFSWSAAHPDPEAEAPDPKAPEAKAQAATTDE
jgi:hypothetical protein